MKRTRNVLGALRRLARELAYGGRSTGGLLAVVVDQRGQLVFRGAVGRAEVGVGTQLGSRATMLRLGCEAAPVEVHEGS